jgi:hypothetical protein
MKVNISEENLAKAEREKERLDLIEKRLEIQKKRIDIKKVKMEVGKIFVETEKDQLELIEKKVEIRSQQLKNKKAKMEMEDLQIDRISRSNRQIGDKIWSVLFPLMVSTVDEDRTILGSEPFYTPLLKGRHKETAMNKLMELINQL